MKIVLLGPSGCGKSTIFHKLCFSAKPTEETTVGCEYAKMNIIIEKQAHEIILWDVAGSEIKSPLMKVYLRDAMGVFLVCDLMQEESMKGVLTFRQLLQLYCNTNEYLDRCVPVIVLQNKADLLIDGKLPKATLSLEDIMANHDDGYESTVMTSGITGQGLREAMESMINLIQQRNLPQIQYRLTRIILTSKEAEYTKEIERLNKSSCF